VHYLTGFLSIVKKKKNGKHGFNNESKEERLNRKMFH